MSQESLSEDAYLFSLRDAYLFTPKGSNPAGSASIADLAGNFTTPNPPDGAVFTYHVGVEAEEEEALVLLIKDDQGELVRELELDSSVGLQRVNWDLRGEAPEASEGGAGQGGGGFQRAGGRVRRGPPVEPGRFVATLGWKVGEDIVEVGEARSFHVVKVQW